MCQSLIIIASSIALGVALGASVYFTQSPITRQASPELPSLAAVEPQRPVVVSVEDPEVVVEQAAPVATQTIQTAAQSPVEIPAIPHAALMTNAGIKADDQQLVYDLLLDENGWRDVSGSRLIDRVCSVGDLQIKLSCANYYVKAKYGTWQHAAHLEIRL